MRLNLGPIMLEAPDDYTPRMFVMTAPEPEKPKTGMMVTRNEQSFARNITVGTEVVDAGTTPERYADQQLSAMKAAMPNFQLLKRGSVKINGADCPLLEIQSSGPEGRLLQAMTAYVVKGATAFTLTGSQMAGLAYSGVRAEYLAIFNSVKLV